MARRSAAGLAFLVEERSVEAIEQLDSVLRIVDARQRLALSVVFLTFAAFGVFSWFYMAPLKVEGRGIILMREQGATDPLVQVTAPASGRITWVGARIGEPVRPGDVIGRVDQSEQLDAIAEAEAELLRLRNEDEALTAFERRVEASKTAALDELRNTLSSNLGRDRARLTKHRRIVEINRDFLRRRYVNDLEFVKAEAEADAVESAIGDTLAKVGDLEFDRVDDEAARREKQLKRALGIEAAETALRLLYERYARDTQIRSQYEGTVVDLMLTPHALIEKGAPAALLRPSRFEDTPTEAIIFMPAGLGKKVARGDEVEITPDTIRRQEHGFIWGEVESVSEIPATEMAMLAELKHKTLVSSFLEQYEGQVLLSIRARLRTLPDDAATATGNARPSVRLEWSSRSTDKPRISNGTLCSASVVVERRPLISLAFPWLKELVGIY